MRDLAEKGKVQFKERITDVYDVGCELVAFSNSRGGKLVIGIDDKTGKINPLSFMELQETTNLLSNMASENVVPSILIEDVENVPVEGGAIVVATISEGINKPYHDNKGIIWVKNGTDKRKVFDNAELAEMMQECGSFNPDEAAVQNATIRDLDLPTIKEYLSQRFPKVLHRKGFIGDTLTEASGDEVASAIVSGHTLEHLLRNLNFIRPDGNLTVAAMLLFGKYTQRWLPVMTAKCISFVGNSVGGKQFRDKVEDSDMEGNLLHQFETIMAFFTRNLRSVQVEKNFNSHGQLEVSYDCLLELVINSLVHRSLNRKAPIRIFIFDDRIEIHSPGTLPGGLTVEDILSGTSMPRNTFLFNNAIYLLPYTGAGSGMMRVVDYRDRMTFDNNERLNEFIITIHRIPEIVAQNEEESRALTVQASNQVTNRVTNQASNQVTRDKALKVKDLDGVFRDIINYCSVPRTSQEILARIGVTNQTENRKKYIMPLVESGLIERTMPESPTAPNQKYRKVKRHKR